MFVYRISRRLYANDLSGTGAGLYGGRWNPKGVALLYTAGSISLTCLEYLAHNFHLFDAEDTCLSKIYIPTPASIEELNPDDLPGDWQEKSYVPASTQQFGADFFHAGRSHILKVPSAIVPQEFNYLLNPLHPDHQNTIIQEQIHPFELDARLFGN